MGYSGFGDGTNNAELETVPEIGPIPQGIWNMEIIKGEDGLPCDYEKKKAPVIRLTPANGTDTFNRAGFLIHGDLIAEAGEELASHGCIVVPKYVREQIAVYVTEGDDQLTVTP